VADAQASIDAQVCDVRTLDQDRILRALTSIVLATLRTTIGTNTIEYPVRARTMTPTALGFLDIPVQRKVSDDGKWSNFEGFVLCSPRMGRVAITVNQRTKNRAGDQ
jgi:hypothetical protein